VGGEIRNNDRTSVWKASGKLDVPIQGGLRLTTSVTWANRREVIKEDEVRGHFGLSYDFSAWQPGQSAK
jgi:hypothetical protein